MTENSLISQKGINDNINENNTLYVNSFEQP